MPDRVDAAWDEVTVNGLISESAQGRSAADGGVEDL